MAPPRLVFDDEPDAKSYNTIKFGKSHAVQAFNKILEDEKETRQDKSGRPMTLYGKSSTRPGGAVFASTPSSAAMTSTAPAPRVPPAVAPRPDKAQLAPINNFAMKMNQLQKDRELKKVDAQKKMDEILAARYQQQKQQRELQRQQTEQDRARQRTAEADALVSEPLWMQNLKNRKKE